MLSHQAQLAAQNAGVTCRTTLGVHAWAALVSRAQLLLLAHGRWRQVAPWLRTLHCLSHIVYKCTVLGCILVHRRHNQAHVAPPSHTHASNWQVLAGAGAMRQCICCDIPCPVGRPVERAGGTARHYRRKVDLKEGSSGEQQRSAAIGGMICIGSWCNLVHSINGLARFIPIQP